MCAIFALHQILTLGWCPEFYFEPHSSMQTIIRIRTEDVEMNEAVLAISRRMRVPLLPPVDCLLLLAQKVEGWKYAM